MENRCFKLFANYNQKANNSMNEIIKTLTEEQWKKQFSGFYKSIQDICSHIYFWDYNELNRCKYLRKFSSLEEEFLYQRKLDIYTIKISEDGTEYLDKNLITSKTLFLDSTIDEYVKMRIDMDNRIINFIDEITTNDLERTITFTTVLGNKFNWRIDDLILNLFNHQTHHRGMISLYLDMLEKENDYSNLILYCE
jgi:uncharacterized damage-inducible protein DinB